MATTNDKELGNEWLPIAFLIYMLFRGYSTKAALLSYNYQWTARR